MPNGELGYGRSDTAAAFEAAITTINDKLHLLGEVSFALVTGDLSDHGTDEEYARFKKIMSRLALPYLAIPGNHDLHAQGLCR
ncbi:metallophosphoesterase [Breoghania sp.]|uniref:metallophosphoesterase n=1 Tax=Breoghania sp. TaxID=2065378 RepID=UPI0026063D9C|nr:metallophosphoesterase [Breoghania sp.]MDJ0932778.1 metallophosphoesterase [Breoghania sp.]